MTIQHNKDMKRLYVLVLGLLCCMTLTSELSASLQFGRDRERGRSEDRVCLYRDIQYQGIEQCFNMGDSVPALQSGLNGQVSSVRVYGRATITVWDDTNFRGHTTAFTNSVPDLARVRLDSKSWSDRIQSIQVSGSAPGYGREQLPPQEISEGI